MPIKAAGLIKREAASGESDKEEIMAPEQIRNPKAETRKKAET
jgi:hypothetical protein